MTTFFTLSDLGLVVSQTQLIARWLSAMQAQYDGYNPSASNLEYVQASVIGSWAQDLGLLCSTGSSELFRNFGTKLVQLPYQAGSPATAVVTVTAIDSVGYTLSAGTQMTLALPGGVELGFLTSSDLVIAPGDSAGNVIVQAVSLGTQFNGAGGPVVLVNQIDWVQEVDIVTSSSGGTDPESDDAYMQRLAATLTTLAKRPITAQDYGVMALDFTPTPGSDQQIVGRATAIDGYNPSDGTYNNPRMVAVFVTDALGNPLSTDTMAAVQAWFNTLREVNFIVNVLSPSYSTVYATVTVRAGQAWDHTVVQGNVQNAILSAINPQKWGLPGTNQAGAWTNYTSINLSRILGVITSAPGVDYVVTGSLALDLHASPTNTTSDLVLPGPVPLPVTTTTSVPLSGITVT